ncbi:MULTISPECIES: DUF1801 domain-containing protein [unclassified Pseudoxanthomonas]|uniref:DUF1801 domain-containing protein n=1 Tax=unclassified Pseudoxanthomonas TaxID=2645906 RepID=UPI0008DF45D6|nr:MULTISPECIES: DUF1801 domain-containing protein [unclassified Pseudoxanthomonas]PPJ41196.1 DUF1801 domain-containing protein [Pseudoxanthomonas sp. KAs_5_3]SFV30985.1 protein of unknown function (DU1801) [Pseudoxanthomonas sp. YR558]
MPVKKSAAPADVGAFLVALAHPQDATIQRLRATVRAADPRIAEDIKWNAPSFHVEGRHFATMQLRKADSVLLVLHLGAGKRALPKDAIADPEGLLTWLGADRATLSFAGPDEVKRRESVLQGVLRQWVAHV